MLKKLYIKNYALIDELTVDFGQGLNILTGETGAGKSIIIGALGMLLGERVRKDVIRQGAKKVVVEGFFRTGDAPRWRSVWEAIDRTGDELILRREISDNGRSRCFANDTPISGGFLIQIGDLLIDLHGQHAHQTLLNTDRHIDYLDDFSEDKTLLLRVADSFKRYNGLTAKLKALQEEEDKIREKSELLSFQVKEIAAIDPKEGEEDELSREEKILKHSEVLFQTSCALSQLLYDGEGSASEKLSTAKNSLGKLRDVNPEIEKWINNCETARIAVEETVTQLQAFVAKIDFDPQALDDIRERLGQFTLLKKKYGGSIEQVIAYRVEAEEQLGKIDSMGEAITVLQQEVESEKSELSRLCLDLSQKRHENARVLEKQTVAVFEELGLKGGVFNIQLDRKEVTGGPVWEKGKTYAATAIGIDQVEFLISLNPGEEPRPLAKIASGGEISRIMLALKTVLAEADDIPVLVFDEIDTGISGRIARVVGENLMNLSRRHQIICITHLPLIASFGNLHYTVEKMVTGDRSQTTIRQLCEKEREIEIAKLIGGDQITDSSVTSARELLNGKR